jgi:hypothetical protein
MQRALFKIGCIDRKHLPSGLLLPEKLDGPHVRKFIQQTGVMLDCGGKPDPVVRDFVRSVAQEEQPNIERVRGGIAVKASNTNAWGTVLRRVNADGSCVSSDALFRRTFDMSFNRHAVRR